MIYTPRCGPIRITCPYERYGNWGTAALIACWHRSGLILYITISLWRAGVVDIPEGLRF